MSNHYEVPNWAGKPPIGLHLDVLKGDKLIQKLMVDEKKCYLFGRNQQMNDFCIDHASCSRVHSALVYHKHLNRAFLVDLGSTHGTYIGNMRLEAQKPTQLPIDSTFHFGASTRYYIIRERPQSGARAIIEEMEKSSDDVDSGGLLGLPETETELDNLTEFNTAHNRRISMLGISDDDVHKPTRKRKKKGITFNDDEEVINPEDVDPSVGRFRNLVQTTVVPSKVVPRRPEASQLLIVHIRRMDVGFPVVYVLMERRTIPLYEAVLRFIQNLVPGLHNNLQTVISDYERAIIRAVGIVFPQATSRGCWFHFCRAVFKKWRGVLTPQAPKDLLWMMMGIPLLPIERQDEALNTLQITGDEVAVQYPGILQMLAYFRRQWLPLRDIISVGTAPMRTNNICETFHKFICGRLGGRHPNIWIFLQKLNVVIASNNIDWIRVGRGEHLRRERKAHQINDDHRIIYQQQQLESRRITVEEFLHIAVLPRQRRAIEAADFTDQAQENDPVPVELPDRHDFPHGNNEVAVIPPAVLMQGNPVPVIEVAIEIDEDGTDDYQPGAFMLPPSPLHEDDVISLSEDDEELINVPLLDQPPEVAVRLEPVRAPTPPGALQQPQSALELAPAPAPQLALAPTPELAPEPALNVARMLEPRPQDNLSDEVEPNMILPACSICLMRPPNIMFLPCGHLIACSHCSEVQSNYDDRCPACRTRIEQRVRSYFA